MSDTKKKDDVKTSPTPKKSRRAHGRVAGRVKGHLRQDSMDSTKYGVLFFLK